MHTYHLNIGSNLGCRELNISRAVRRLEEHFGYFEISKATASEPLGFESSHSFLNVGLRVWSDMEPEEVLETVLGVQNSISSASHRNPDGSYADRIIDIDIVACDDIVIDTPTLKLPHPHLPERDFFLRPMSELDPQWRHPITGMTCPEMLNQLGIRN